jgi:HAE1 family hydrophobic/amphiphilic exporter-1
MAILDAVAEAAKIRFRPILMTSLATIFGVLPIAIGLGAGGEARRPLGIAVVGGMAVSTFLTMVLVPVVYTFLARYTKAVPIADAPEPESDRVAAPPRPEAEVAAARQSL